MMRGVQPRYHLQDDLSTVSMLPLWILLGQSADRPIRGLQMSMSNIQCRHKECGGVGLMSE